MLGVRRFAAFAIRPQEKANWPAVQPTVTRRSSRQLCPCSRIRGGPVRRNSDNGNYRGERRSAVGALFATSNPRRLAEDMAMREVASVARLG